MRVRGNGSHIARPERLRRVAQLAHWQPRATTFAGKSTTTCLLTLRRRALIRSKSSSSTCHQRALARTNQSCRAHRRSLVASQRRIGSWSLAHRYAADHVPQFVFLLRSLATPRMTNVEGFHPIPLDKIPNIGCPYNKRSVRRTPLRIGKDELI